MKPPPLPPPRQQLRSPQAQVKDERPSMYIWLLGGSMAIILLLFLFALIVRNGANRFGSGRGSSEAGQSIGELNAVAGSSGSPRSDPNSASKSSDSQTQSASSDPLKSDTEASSTSDTKNPPASETVSNQPVFQIYDGSRGQSAVIGASSKGGANPFLGAKDFKKVVFVIDKSGSMAGGALDRVKAALIEAIESLSDDQQLQVIFFESSASFQPKLQGLVPATDSNKSQFVEWISRMTPNGGTEPVEAVKAGLSLNPELLIILSDGEFNPRYVAQITQFNQSNHRPARIDCVGLAEQVQSLKQIAKDNGPGIYYQAR